MKTKTNIDFLQYRKYTFIVSIAIIILGIIFFIIRGGFNLGLDFQGGIRATISIESEESIKVDNIRSMLSSELPGIEITERLNQDNIFEITYKSSEYEQMEETQEENANEGEEEVTQVSITEIINEKVLPILRERYGQGVIIRAIGDEEDIQNIDINSTFNKTAERIENLSFNLTKKEETVTQDGKEKSIDKYIYRVETKKQEYKIEDFVTMLNQTVLGSNDFEITEIVELMKVDSFEPTVGKDIQDIAFAVAALIIVLILGYLALRFQFKFGVAAVIAVVHDALIIMAILLITGIEVGIQSVTAILTIIGYSLNDTIVVFDRIRENTENINKEEYMFVVNKSINQVIYRTIITSVTTLLAVLSLLILGGPAIFELSFSIAIGIIVGTYSSIFIASPVLIIWEDFLHKREEKKKEKQRKAKKST